jgi:hypothetical protein
MRVLQRALARRAIASAPARSEAVSAATVALVEAQQQWTLGSRRRRCAHHSKSRSLVGRLANLCKERPRRARAASGESPREERSARSNRHE